MSDSESAPAATPSNDPAAAPVTETATPTTESRRPGSHGVRVMGVLVIIIGFIFVVAGAGTYYTVSTTLSDEQITVSDDAKHFAGDPVDSPWTAYAQANAIEQHALEAGGGKTYAELPQDDPKRDTVMTASFLRASLFTSVVAFGVAFLVFGLGITLILVGWALVKVGKFARPPDPRPSPFPAVRRVTRTLALTCGSSTYVWPGAIFNGVPSETVSWNSPLTGPLAHVPVTYLPPWK